MKPLPLQQVRQVISAKALSALPADASIKSICTDTRMLEAGCLFVALRGDRFDAHNFLGQAAAGGAIAAVVEDPPQQLLPNLHTMQVASSRAALGKLARHVRTTFSAKVIAVGGSNGKTTTKHLIDSALCRKLRGSISPKSFNNDIGVPLTIFSADPAQDYLVLEMGTNHHGELKPLSEMAQPDIAVITSISAEHLEGLGDLMGVRREEASIIAGLNPKGLLVVNGDDPDLLQHVGKYPGKVIKFGFAPTNDLFATDVYLDHNGTRFNLNGSRREVFVPLLGRHTASNALAAIAVARRLGLEETDIIESLAEARGPDMRLQLQQLGGVTVLNDAYNANPASMHAALDTLTALASPGRRIAVLGEMLELGDHAVNYHREMGRHVAALSGKFDVLICVGELANHIADSAIASGFNPNLIERYADSRTAANMIPDLVDPGDLVLLKGSRGVHLELIASALGGGGPTMRRVAG